MNDYRAASIAIKDLSSDTIRQMASLYLDNYEGTSEDLFRRDLTEKDEAIVLHSGDALVGFTTLRFFPESWAGRSVGIVYSGDTIVNRKDWGQQKLAFAWIRRIGEIKAQAPDTPLYWFLLVKGHRTFKYLSVFGESFFPHWKIDRSDLKPLADQLAGATFGHDYDPARGIVAFPTSRGHLKASLAEPCAEELSRDATRFFLARNPGFRQGHELVCICELEQANLKPLAARLFSRGLGAARTP